MDNTFGQGKASTVPAEIDHWNWGAFLLNWIWGIKHNIFISLLIFIPFFNLFIPFLLGLKGSTWAWQNKKWESIEQFKETQRSWTKWGVIIWGGCVGLTAIAVLVFINTMKHSEAYILGTAKLNANTQAVSLLGEHIATGFPMGSIHINGAQGNAQLSFSATGTKGKGEVYLEATKEMGSWTVIKEELAIPGQENRINLNQ